LSPRGRSLYLDRPSARRRSSSYYSGSGGRGGGTLRRIGYVVVLLVVLAVAAGVVQWTRAVPDQRAVRSFEAAVAAGGSATQLPWPKEGQAAVAVKGVGLVGSAGESQPAPIASLAKMMTAYQILQDHPLGAHEAGSALTVDAAAVKDYQARARKQQSVLAVHAGERLSEYKALQALLIPSANNIAALLAEWDARSVPRFVAKMNATADRLGLADTHYADADGSSPRTVSTAVDQLALAQEAMKLPVFASIVAQPAATFPDTGKLFNYNYNIGHHGFIGIKTGSHAAAGGCWAFAARRTVAGESSVVYGVVLGQHAKNGALIQPALNIGRRLADAVPGVVTEKTLVEPGTEVGSLTAEWRDDVRLVTRDPVTVLTTPGAHYPVDLELTPPSGRSVQAGQVVGQLTVGSVTTPVVAERSAPGPTLKWRLTRL
jgi:D-alanyl-D-alanine carboxypeptidase (penicillin-binding protein 5/6)